MPAEETWAADTWVTGPRIGEIESLAVLPEHRGRGLGSSSSTAWSASSAPRASPTSCSACSRATTAPRGSYARRGYRPTWLYISRFGS